MEFLDLISLCVAICFAYFMGAIPFGLVVTKYAGVGDIRNIGSGNIGATNVLRTGKKSLAALTLALDIFKGYAAIYVATHLFMPPHLKNFEDQFLSYTALAVVVGHVFPIWLKLKGGKGVATAFGVFAFIQPLWAVMLLIIWFGMALSFQYSSLAAITACLLAPFLGLWVFNFSDSIFYSVFGICILIILRHYGNIVRLLHGTEGKIALVKPASGIEDENSHRI